MITQILIFLLVLSVLILAHEFGHYWVAKKNNVWVEEFGFGLPPRIWSKKIGQTIWSVNLLPFGGFVRLHGENTEEDLAKPTRAFSNKSKKARIAIITAGVFMNVVLAIFAFAITYSFTGIPRETDRVKVLEVDAGSPAQTAGILVGDTISSVGKESVESVSEFIELVDANKGDKVSIVLVGKEKGETVEKKVSIRPRENPPEGEGPLGVTISSTEIYFPPIWQRPFVGIYYGLKDALFWGKTIVVGFFGLFVNLFKGEGTPRGISGPVGIFAVTSQAASYGALSLINFIGILSLNLAVLNIIPFPALDGGRLLFIFLEKFMGRKVLPKVEAIIHSVGMIILLILLLAVTVKDIRLLIQSGSLSGFVDKILN